MEDIAKLVNRLFTVGEKLSQSVQREIIEHRHEAEPLLIAMIDDDSLYAVDARGRGYAPLHALKLLGEMKSVAAIPSMLRVLRESDHMDIAYSAAIHALEALGEHMLEPGLAEYAATADEKFRDALVEVLAGIGVRDERVYQLLVERLPIERTLGAGNLVTYGDARALPHLGRALDQYEFVRADSPFANHDVIELAAAIEDLGGQLTELQRRKLDRARAPGQRFRQQMLDAYGPDSDEESEERPGRNDPCYCGSGKKYKKCHLPEDESSSLM